MKYEKLISAIALLVVLAIPVSLAAQEHPAKHHQYKLVDMGTLGGPASAVNSGASITINSRGLVIGAAETSVSDPPHSNPFPCGPGTYVYHGFEWGEESGVKDLGALAPAEDDCVNVGGINASGEISGVSENGVIDPLTGFTEVRAVIWKDGQIKDLGTLGGNHSFSAGSINDRGQVVGAALNNIPDPYSLFDLNILGSSNGTQTRAFLWPDGKRRKMRDLGTLGGPDAIAQFVNEGGQVAGISYTSSIPSPATGVPPVDPFLWEPRGKGGKMIDLGSLGGTSAGPGGLNKLGQVVGTSNLKGDIFYHPFFWEEGKKLQDLYTLGGNYGSATRINDAGEVVGWANLKGDQVNHAFLWKKGQKKLKDLGILKGDMCDAAWDINSKTQVIGASGNCVNGVGLRAFLWENGSIIDLNKLIPPGSSLHLSVAFFISDSGEIAGVGLPSGCTNTDACGHAFVLIPCDHRSKGCDDVPEGEAPVTQISPPAVSQGAATVAPRSPLPNQGVAPFSTQIRGYRTSGGGA